MVNHATFQRREGHASARLQRCIAASQSRLRDLREGKPIIAIIDEAREKNLLAKTHSAPQRNAPLFVFDREPEPSETEENEPEEEVKEEEVKKLLPGRSGSVESLAVLQLQASEQSRVNAMESICKPPEVLVTHIPIALKELEEKDMAGLFHKTIVRMTCEPVAQADWNKKKKLAAPRKRAWHNLKVDTTMTCRDHKSIAMGLHVIQSEELAHRKTDVLLEKERPDDTNSKFEEWHHDVVSHQEIEEKKPSTKVHKSSTRPFDFFDRASRHASKASKQIIAGHSSSGRPRSQGSSAPRNSGSAGNSGRPRSQGSIAPSSLGRLSSAPQLNATASSSQPLPPAPATAPATVPATAASKKTLLPPSAVTGPAGLKDQFFSNMQMRGSIISKMDQRGLIDAGNRAPVRKTEAERKSQAERRNSESGSTLQMKKSDSAWFDRIFLESQYYWNATQSEVWLKVTLRLARRGADKTERTRIMWQRWAEAEEYFAKDIRESMLQRLKKLCESDFTVATEDTPEDAFSKADKDNDGYLTPEEAKKALEQAGMSSAEAAEAAKFLDADGDGKVSRKEWMEGTGAKENLTPIGVWL